MTKIYKLKHTGKVYDKLLDKRIERGDYEGVLNAGYYTIYKLHDESYSLYEKMAKANYMIEEYAKAVNFWFLYLANCDEDFKAVAYNGLGACFYKMENKELATHYFNEYYRRKNKAIYEYDDILSELFDDLSNNRDKYYLAYPYNKANFDKLLNKVVTYIKSGYYEKALNELEIIPSDSRYYVDALIQKSLCKYIIGNTEDALKDISLAVELDGNNTIALFNAISMFYASGKTAETKKMLDILTASSEYTNIENAEKIAMIFCELKDYAMAEKFLDTALKEYPYRLNLLLLNGITKYNLKKFDKALDIFSKCNRLLNSYVHNYYIKITKSAIKKAQNGSEIPFLDYTFDVQKKEYNRIVNRFNKFISEENIDKKNHKELSILFDYVYEKCDTKLLNKMLSILNKIDDNYAIRIACKYLLKVDMLDNVKRALIALIIYKGFNNRLCFVYGNLYHELDIEQPNFDENCGVLKDAYSICVSKLAGLENDIYPIKKATDKIICAIKNGLDAKLLDDVFSLSAVLFEISNIKPIKSRRVFLEYFQANQRTVKNYKELIKNFDYSASDEFEKFIKELESLDVNETF